MPATVRAAVIYYSAAQLKQSMDTTGSLWAAGKLADEVYSSSTSAATLHGGHETTITAMNDVFYSWGGIIVPPAYADSVQSTTGTPYGASFVSNDGQVLPDDDALASAAFQGRRAVEVAALLAAGRAGLSSTAPQEAGIAGVGADQP